MRLSTSHLRLAATTTRKGRFITMDKRKSNHMGKICSLHALIFNENNQVVNLSFNNNEILNITSSEIMENQTGLSVLLHG